MYIDKNGDGTETLEGNNYNKYSISRSIINITITFSTNTPTMTIKLAEEGSTSVIDGIQFAIKSRVNQRGAIFLCSVVVLVILNYDSSGPWRWAQNNFGLFIWDSQTIIVMEAQATNNDNMRSTFGDILLLYK